MPQNPHQHPLSLHHLTALDTTPIELIRIAGALECANVCLFTHIPEAARRFYPLVDRAMTPDIAIALADNGVALANLEVFPLDHATALDEFREGLKVGARLGARMATAHIHIADEAEAIDRFARFCDMAAEYQLTVGLEFNGFSKCVSPEAAARIVRGSDRPNSGIVLDMLHAVRSGAAPDTLAAIAPLISYAQICDGPATMPEDGRWHEAIRERMPPGEGDFPITAMLALLKPGVIVDIEVPAASLREAGVSAYDRAKRAFDATLPFIRT